MKLCANHLLTIGCTATDFPPLRGSKPAREPGVRRRGQGRLFPEYDTGNGHRTKLSAQAVILDPVWDEDGDDAASVTDVALFLTQD